MGGEGATTPTQECATCDGTGWTFDYLGPDPNDMDGEKWGDVPCTCSTHGVAGRSVGSEGMVSEPDAGASGLGDSSPNEEKESSEC